jgi:hypothetical protein
MFKKAERQMSKLRLGLIGPSGSGKTYSALLIAKGLGGKVAMLDSERGSGSLYSDLVDYDIAQLTPPFSPQAYIQGITEAGQAGYDVLIIDSLSHAWSGQGGVLEEVDKRKASQKNQFAAWRDVTPMHNALVDAILQSPCHVIVTMRSKTAYDMTKDETGKVRPVKIGLAPVQRDGLEYEFSCVLELAVEKHVCTASKDRTGLFDGQYFVPGVETGQTLKAWLNGDTPANGQDVEGPAMSAPKKPDHKQAKRQDIQVPQTIKAEGSEPQAEDVEKPMAETPNGTSARDLIDLLRKLGLAGEIQQYERYLAGKYDHGGLRDLTVDQIREQYFNLGRCTRDEKLAAQFTDFLRGLKKAA